VKKVSAFLGVIQLMGSRFLFCVEEVSQICKLEGLYEVFMIENLSLIPFQVQAFCILYQTGGRPDVSAQAGPLARDLHQQSPAGTYSLIFSSATALPPRVLLLL